VQTRIDALIAGLLEVHPDDGKPARERRVRRTALGDLMSTGGIR
jgi:hypothetical protein